ncbi:hypothetical protein D9M70_443190 [compost metagenome]
MLTASPTLGSCRCTGWKRRARAGSFSMCWRYSRQVVAAMVRSSPRASAGLSRLAASAAPAWLPAPIRVWASSMNRMSGFGELRTSSITPCRRRSNSPLTPAPACSRPRSRPSSSTSLRLSGTSPAAMRRARPSTSAVLPTPASPTTIGLFLRRRARMSISWRIAVSRHSTGSSRPARAWAVKLWVKRARADSPSAHGAASGAPGRLHA